MSDLLERAKILLKATKDLLEKQENSCYVLNILSQTVFYDGVDCDGNCLKDDIGYWFDELEDAQTVKSISLEKVKQAREQIVDEKDFAYADFDRYKEEVLCVEPDELPDDDFRYGMERCLTILDKLIEGGEKL